MSSILVAHLDSLEALEVEEGLEESMSCRVYLLDPKKVVYHV